MSTGADGLKAVRYTKAFASTALPAAIYYVYEQAQGGTPVVSYYDVHHRVILTEKSGFDGRTILQSVGNNAKGKATHKSNPYFSDTAAAGILFTQYFYDDFDRQWKVTSPDGSSSTATFAGLSSTSTMEGNANQAAQSKTGVHDEHGRVIQSIDNVGNQVYFTYTADGLPQTATTTFMDNSPTTTVVTTYDDLTRAKPDLVSLPGPHAYHGLNTAEVGTPQRKPSEIILCGVPISCGVKFINLPGRTTPRLIFAASAPFCGHASPSPIRPARPHSSSSGLVISVATPSRIKVRHYPRHRRGCSS